MTKGRICKYLGSKSVSGPVDRIAISEGTLVRMALGIHGNLCAAMSVFSYPHSIFAICLMFEGLLCITYY